jgi:hypothetical protein
MGKGGGLMGAPAVMAGAMGAQALGGLWQGFGQQKAANKANQRQDQLLGMAQGMQQNGPSNIENALLQLFQGTQGQGQYTPQLTNMQNILQGSGYNAGQDALMQMLRSSGQTQVDRSLSSILEGQGNPFDNSQQFQALHQLDLTNMGNQVAGLQGSSKGLGQRFGSAMMQNEGALRQNMANNIGARNAQIQQGSYESAQNRLLQATGQLTGREQFNSGMQANIANLLQQAGLGLVGAQSQTNTANNNSMAQAMASMFAGNAQSSGLLQMLLGAEQNRRGFNLSTLGLQGGMMEPYTTPGLGGAFSNMGQLAMMLPFLLQMQGQSGGQGFPTSWAR